MTRQFQRKLYTRRELCKALVDADLEEEGARLMPQHDAGGDRRVAGAQCHDLAITGLGELRRRAADEGGIALDLRQRCAAPALPAARFKLQEHFQRGGDLLWRPRDVEGDLALFGEALAQSTQLF